MATVSSNGAQPDIASLIQKIDSLNQKIALMPVWHLDANGTPDGLKDPGGTLIPLPGAIKGTTTNDNAPAGDVGEYISSTVAVGSAVSLTTTVAVNVTSISLTAGDWDVSGVIAYHSASGTTVPADVLQGISTTSATVPALGSYSYDVVAVAIPEDIAYVAPWTRLSLAATTTVYLVARSDFSVSTLTAYGYIGARRVR